eukprot:5128467-Amphidinium_carterae.1
MPIALFCLLPGSGCAFNYALVSLVSKSTFTRFWDRMTVGYVWQKAECQSGIRQNETIDGPHCSHGTHTKKPAL